MHDCVCDCVLLHHSWVHLVCQPGVLMASIIQSSWHTKGCVGEQDSLLPHGCMEYTTSVGGYHIGYK